MPPPPGNGKILKDGSDSIRPINITLKGLLKRSLANKFRVLGQKCPGNRINISYVLYVSVTDD